MPDWADQISRLQHSWLEQQRQLFTGWFGNLQYTGSGIPHNVWRQMIDANELQINSILDTQQKLLSVLINTFGNTGNLSPETAQWTRQMEQGIDLWIDIQQRLWEVWFDMLRNASPGNHEPGETIIKNLQDLAERAVEIQEQWLSGWPDDKSGRVTSSGKRPTRSPASRRSSGAKSKNRGKSKN